MPVVVHPMLAAACKRHNLTPRDTEVLAAISEGDTHKSAADRLGCRRATIRDHIQRIRLKIGAASTSQVFVILLTR